MAQKSFTFDFEDRSPKSIAYECERTERLRTSIEAGGPFVFANRAGMLALAKLLVKLSMGEYTQGSHIHLRSDFSGDPAPTGCLDDSVGRIPWPALTKCGCLSVAISPLTDSVILVTSGQADRDYHFSHMKAAVYTKAKSGKVLEMRDLEQPVPKDNEVVIRVRAASVNPLDWRMKSQRPGVDVAGQVAAVGGTVTQFKPGDAVLGICKGAFAEYACAPEAKLVRKPESVSFDQAAAVPIAGLTALQGLRDKRTPSAGAEGLDQRRGGRNRHPCRADREGIWG